jgi:uncharacterized protein
MSEQERSALVGVTKGPGETPHEYTFISCDEDHILRTGEYVWYSIDDSSVTRHVLGRITERRSVQSYPDTFLADPTISPGSIAAMIGFDGAGNDLFELTVAIMGYYRDDLGAFVNPWIPPQSGKPIYLADDSMLSAILSKRRRGERGSAYIGDLLTRSSGAVPIVIDIREIVSTHLAIIASTGAGKSYLAGVMIEELMQSYNRAAVLIIDPHGEYSTLEELRGHEAFSSPGGNGLAAYRPDVRVFRHDQVKVRLSSLRLSDLRYLLPEMTEKQQYLLNRGYRKLQDQKHGGQPWTAQDLIKCIRESASSTEEGRDDSGTVGALEWKIEQRLSDNEMTFSPSHQTELRDLFRPGQCTVLQINEIDERDQQVIVATILRRLYQARMETVRGKASAGQENYLPYPVFVLLEEAHHFAPAHADVISTGVLKQVLAEGRKFGVGVGLISQRPGKLDSDVLSQCQTQCIMRIVNEIDQHTVATAIESVGHELLQNLPALSKGQVIIAGSAVNTPVLCRVRQRITKHGGESHDAPAEWQRHFSADSEADRARADAVMPLPSSQMPIMRGGTRRM